MSNKESINKIKKEELITEIDESKKEYEYQMTMLSSALKKLGFNNMLELQNPKTMSKMNILKLVEELEEKDIFYFAGDFGLRKAYEKNISILERTAINEIEKMILKLNKINSLRYTKEEIKYHDFLVKSGLARLYLSKEVIKYKSCLKDIRDYKIKGNVEELLKTKYNDKEYLENIDCPSLEYGLDLLTLEKLGLQKEVERCDYDMKNIIYIKTLGEKVITK